MALYVHSQGMELHRQWAAIHNDKQ